MYRNSHLKSAIVYVGVIQQDYLLFKWTDVTKFQLLQAFLLLSLEIRMLGSWYLLESYRIT